MRARLVLLTLLGAVTVLGAALLLRATTSTVAEDIGDGRITAECTGWTGVSDGCGDWGREILAGGAPSSTFEMEDVVRIRLDRSMLGFASGCVVDYFVSRYPDEAAWTEEVLCPGG